MTLIELNRLSESAVEAEFARCCGSMRWARLMASERPFANRDVVVAISQRLWWSLEAADWLEAFAAHPRIGERPTSDWSAQEQSEARALTASIRDRLARGNHEYEHRFGYTFLICATGQSAEQILEALERRLQNKPGDELQIAANEQRKITDLRLMKLIAI